MFNFYIIANVLGLIRRPKTLGITFGCSCYLLTNVLGKVVYLFDVRVAEPFFCDRKGNNEVEMRESQWEKFGSL